MRFSPPRLAATAVLAIATCLALIQQADADAHHQHQQQQHHHHQAVNHAHHQNNQQHHPEHRAVNHEHHQNNQQHHPEPRAAAGSEFEAENHGHHNQKKHKKPHHDKKPEKDDCKQIDLVCDRIVIDSIICRVPKAVSDDGTVFSTTNQCGKNQCKGKPTLTFVEMQQPCYNLPTECPGVDPTSLESYDDEPDEDGVVDDTDGDGDTTETDDTGVEDDEGDEDDNTGVNSSNTDVDSDNTDTESDNTDTDSDNTDADSDNTDADSDNTDADSDNTDADSDNTDADSDNTDADSDNTDVDSSNTDADSDNTDVDSDNTDVDSEESIAGRPSFVRVCSGGCNKGTCIGASPEVTTNRPKPTPTEGPPTHRPSPKTTDNPIPPVPTTSTTTTKKSTTTTTTRTVPTPTKPPVPDKCTCSVGSKSVCSSDYARDCGLERNSVYECSASGKPKLLKSCLHDETCITLDNGGACASNKCKCPKDGVICSKHFPAACGFGDKLLLDCVAGERPDAKKGKYCPYGCTSSILIAEGDEMGMEDVKDHCLPEPIPTR
ncbi:hypothetical protein BGZ83_000836, partial [Gryganskiella cystojenkinii]